MILKQTLAMLNSNITISKIINEEIEKLLELNNDDIVGQKNIDLYDEYDKLNRLLFDGKLPRVSMKWSNRKGSFGHVNALINRRTGESKVNYLGMSSFHSMPYRVFKNTLAHEMIHVKQIIDLTHDINNPHGRRFQEEANRINNMGLGFNITAVSDENLGVSDNIKPKNLVGIILKIDGNNYLAVTKNNVYEEGFDRIVNMYEKLVNRGKYREIDITVVESNNPQMQKYKILRTFNSGISYSPISNELLSNLLQGTVLRNYKIRRDVPVVVSEDTHNNDWEEMIII